MDAAPARRNDSRQRLMIIGARGFIGEYLARAAEPAFEVHSGVHTPDEGDSLPRPFPIDITDPASVRAAFDQRKPDVAALLAAISDIDVCEREPARAEAINVGGVRHVARECA